MSRWVREATQRGGLLVPKDRLRQNVPVTLDGERIMVDKPIEYDTTPVWVQGEALDPVWWRGRQWAVTRHGLECLNGAYEIAADRLDENISRHGWPAQLAAKIWTDYPDFATAWLVAIAMHGTEVDPTDVHAALERGQAVVDRHAQWLRDHPDD